MARTSFLGRDSRELSFACYVTQPTGKRRDRLLFAEQRHPVGVQTSACRTAAWSLNSNFPGALALGGNRLVRLCGLLGIRQEFLAEDGDVARCFDPQANLAPVNIDDGDADVEIGRAHV